MIHGLPAISGASGGELSWNIFKVDCPSIKLGVDAREIDMIPRFTIKNYEYDDLSVSFIESSELKFRYFFYQWMTKALGPDSYTRNYYSHVVASSFEIHPIDFNGNSSIADVFHEILPYDINSINYDIMDDGTQTALTTVKFKYMRHLMKKL